MMMMIRCLDLVLLLLGTSVVTQAVKDSAWHNGIETPNVALPMYWGDTPNILEDIGNFTKLYVKYHSCAWNQLGGYGEQESTGHDVEENDYWYMGAMSSGAGWSYGPQVAFSLYGSLKGSMRKGCNQNTYINSFYTTSGFYAFTNTLASAGISNDGSSFSLYCQNGVEMTCSSTGNGFSLTKYGDSYCTRGDEVGEEESDALDNFNNVLDDATCVEIYDSNSGKVPYLLYHSRSCELQDEAGACPDPYGKKSYYESRLSRALAGLAPDDENYHQELVKGYSFLGSGAMFIFLAAVLAAYEKCFGPRRVSKTKSLDNDTVDVEAMGELKRVPILGKQDKGKLDNEPNTEAVVATKSATLEQLEAVSFAPALFKCGEDHASFDDEPMLCGGQPALETVLDHVENAVAATNIECTSDERIMSFVKDTLDGNAPDTGCLPFAVDSASNEPTVAEEKQASSAPVFQSTLSLLSKVGKTGETTSEARASEKETQEPDAKETITSANDIEISQSDANNDSAACTPVLDESSATITADEVKAESNSTATSPKITEEQKKKFMFWKG
jgi:hypothetical protein